jgi:hypothetical protein
VLDGTVRKAAAIAAEGSPLIEAGYRYAAEALAKSGLAERFVT